MAAGLFPAITFAALAPPHQIRQMSYGENTDAVGGVTAPIPTATGFSGSLYGSGMMSGLLEYDLPY